MTTSPLQIARATEWPYDALAECFTAAFEGYIAGSITLSALTLPRFLERQGADLSLSRCVVSHGELVGICFIGQYAQRRRIGGMGLRPQARGTGASRQLLSHVIDEARRDGMAAVELEVFVQNAPAVALYRSAGFVDGPALWGFSGEPFLRVEHEHERQREQAASPDIVTASQAADWLLTHGRDDLPYQASGHALHHADPAAIFWRLGQALMVFSEPANQQFIVPLLFDADLVQQDAQRLLDVLLQRHPRHSVRVPQLMRDDCAAQAFRRAGFTPLPIHQVQMRLAL
jgi:ribosomal protein S18 acetylase RimI-like enzyme